MSSERHLILGAAIVGVAVIAGSLVLALSLGQVTDQLERTSAGLDAIRASVDGAKQELANLPTAPRPTARTGPDPNRRYRVETDGAPALGPPTAAVTIVAFSDFQ